MSSAFNCAETFSDKKLNTVNKMFTTRTFITIFVFNDLNMSAKEQSNELREFRCSPYFNIWSTSFLNNREDLF